MISTLALRVWLLVLALGSAAIAVHAFSYLYQDVRLGNPFHVSFALAGWAVPLHFFGAGLALLVAPLQLVGRLRARWPALHRMLGWLYVLAVLIGGLSGIVLAPRAQGGWSVGSSFLLLGVLWLLVTGWAVACAIRGRHAEHRRWMLRSMALTFAAVTLRLYLGLGLGVFDMGFLDAYLAAAWLCWTVNLGWVELYLWRVPHLRSLPRRAAGTRSASVPAGA